MTSEDRLNILFICTANQCRSPLALVLAKEQLRQRGVNATISSAGYLSGGVEAAEGSQKAAKKRGLDLSDHVSQRLDADMINGADVVIGMEPGHILDLVDEVAGSQAWALTLKELASYARAQKAAAWTTPLTTEEIRSWVRSAGARDLQSLLTRDTTINDPMGRSNRAFRATAKEIDELLTEVFDAWFGPVKS